MIHMPYCDLSTYDLADRDGFHAFLDFMIDSDKCDIMTRDEPRSLFLLSWLEMMAPAGKC